MDVLDLFQRLGLALAIGFLIGVERGWKSRGAEDESRVAGLRTYTLIGLLGGVSGLIGALFGPVVLAALALSFSLAWLVYKAWETLRDGDLSITGLVAGLIVFALGAYAARGSLAIAAAAGVALVSVLAFKSALHDWLARLTWPEIRSALLILAATFIALPLLPDRALDPYGAFNPREIWLLTIVIAGASFAGYVALRALGPGAGLYIGAGAGALVSSTVVTYDLARRTKAEEVDPLQAAAAACLANLVMFLRVGALIAIFAAPAFVSAAPILGAAIGATLLAAATLAFLDRRPGRAEAAMTLKSPLNVASVVRFALLLGAIIAAARLIAHFYGASSLTLFAATAGLVDVDAVALAVGGLVREGLAPPLGVQAVLIAAGVDTLSKAAIALYAGRARFAVPYALASVFAIAVAIFALFAFGALGGS